MRNIEEELQDPDSFVIEGYDANLVMRNGVPNIMFYFSEMEDEPVSGAEKAKAFAERIYSNDSKREVALYVVQPFETLLNNFAETHGYVNDADGLLHVGESDKEAVDKTIVALKAMLKKLETVVYEPDPKE